MEVVIVVATGLFILAFALIPKLFKAQVRGQTASLSLGHTPNGIPMNAGDGLRQVVLDGEIGAGLLEAMLIDERLDVRLHRDSGGGLGGIAAIYVLLYREKDEQRVLEAVAAQQA